MSMSHTELTRVAFNWLIGSQRCAVVVSELATSGQERADSLGWKGGDSILVEVKVSIADLRADLNKPWRSRRLELGMGHHRYYMVPPELKEPAAKVLPEGWGLLVPNGRGVNIIEYSRQFRANRYRETLVLESVIRRIAGERHPLPGVGVKTYIHEMAPENPVAMLSVAPEN